MKFDFSQITQMLNKLDINIRYGIFILILLAIFFSDLIIIIFPLQISAINKLSDNTKVTQQSIEQLKTDYQRIDQVKKLAEKNKIELDRLNSKIRPVGEIASVMEDVSTLASEVGVKIDQITPQPDAQKLLVSNDSIKYYTLPLVIQANSGYHNFGYFLNRLENGKLLFMMSTLVIETKKDDVKQTVINATIKVVMSEKNTDGAKK